MNFDFDTVIDRRGTRSQKWNVPSGSDHLALAVSEMDFRPPPKVAEEMLRFGRSTGVPFEFLLDDELTYERILEWRRQRMGERRSREEVTLSAAGVITSMLLFMEQHRRSDSGVVMLTPAYGGVGSLLDRNGYDIRFCPLDDRGNGKIGVNFDLFERLVSLPDTRFFVNISPHNPTGKVFTEEELTLMAEICACHDTLIVTDEIHGDLDLRRRHRTAPDVSDTASRISAAFTSGTKAFNLTGVNCSYSVIPNPRLRTPYVTALARWNLDRPNVVAVAMLEQGYRSGDWLDAAKAYIADNQKFVVDSVREHGLPIDVYEPDGTYLMWLDFTNTGRSAAELDDIVRRDARLTMSPGHAFTGGDSLHMRLAAAGPRSVLAEAIRRLADSFARLS